MENNNNYGEPRLNRYLHARARANGVPLAGNFELTPCCNLQCRMCYVRQSAQQVREQGGLLRGAQWLRWGEEAAARGMLFLLLTGGEPLTHPDFREIYTGLKKLGLMLSLNTNGTLIDRDMADLLIADAPTRVNISLYGGGPAAYERLCGRADAFQKTVDAIRMLRAAGVAVKLNFCATPYNAGDAEPVFRLAGELGLRVQPTAYMFPPLRRGAAFTDGGERFAPEEAAAVQARCDRLRMTPESFLRRARDMEQGVVPDDPDAECMELPAERIRCRAGSTAFWLTWDGFMTPCGMLPRPAANVREAGFGPAWEQTKAAASGIFLPAKCAGCGLRHACTVCPAACLTETGGFGEAPDYLCRMTRALIAETGAEARRVKEESHAHQT